jgi:glucose/arabinose dehydrogenase
LRCRFTIVPRGLRWIPAVILPLLLAGAVDALELEPFLSGLSSPLYVTHSRDGTGRLFVVEKAGVIKVVPPGSRTPTVFLDISDRVLSTGGEQGLLGLAFHPQFASNGRFFVNYTTSGGGFAAGTTVIAEYGLASANTASRTERVVLTIPRPDDNHNAGMIEFGPDGFLYIAAGDSGGANDPQNLAQNPGVLQGKILRIDVNGAQPYAIPGTNPFVGVAGVRAEIWALGFRNPFRFSFDRATGQLIVADVGQSASEEIDIVTPGANFGWDVIEGFTCTGPTCDPQAFTPPIAAYGHTGGRCSVTGGYVYRGRAGTLPVGTYVFGDFCSGEIFTIAGTGAVVLLDTTVLLSSFGEDEAGELYVADLGGAVHRLIGGPAEAVRQAFITGFYASVLGRGPSAADLIAWADFLRANCNPAGVRAVVRAFFSSGEFAARPLSLAGHIATMYRSLLGRDPDPAGLAAWAHLLRQSRLQLALGGFIPSPEFRALLPDRTNRAAVEAVLARFYTEILGRAPDAQGLARWVDFVVASGSLETAAVGFLASAEFEARPLSSQAYVTVLYRAFLGRAPDPMGLAAWQSAFQAIIVGIAEAGFVPAAEFNLAALCG